jgi:hypothetical protein
VNYSAERFGSTFEKEEGAAIWEFLTGQENIVRMETATYLSRPAIEPMSPLLVEQFGPRISADRIKQMMGHMVRQIMEQRGHRLQQGNVKITSNGNIFSRASRYIAVPEVTE